MSLWYRAFLTSFGKRSHSAFAFFLQSSNYLQKSQNCHFSPWHITLLSTVICSIALSGCSSFVVNPAGQGSASTGALVASPASLSFGSVKVGQTSTATVTFSNSGSTAVHVSSFSVAGKPFTASSDSSLPFTLGPGASFHMAVQFKPVNDGSTTGSLTISGDSLKNGTETVDLSGAGTESTVSAVSALSCAKSTVSAAATDACQVTLNGAAPSAGVSVNLESSSGAVKTPGTVMVAANATSATFNATISAVSSSQTVKLTASEGGATSTFDIQLQASSGSTSSPAVSALSCAESAETGAATDACQVTLNGAAPSAGISVKLESSSSAVKIPGTVTVPANAKNASFNATVSAVTSNQTVELTASDGGATSTFQLQLHASASGPAQEGPGIQVSAGDVSFGDVLLNSPATQPVTLTSTGASPLTITAMTLSGAGFQLASRTLPFTLASQQSITLNLVFDPTASGTVQGELTISSNATNAPNDSIALTGTGVSHRIELNWDAPANSPVTIEGYHVYRTSNGGTAYQLLNTTLDQNTSFTDGSVQSGQTYEYVVKAVDTSGVESPPSNSTSVSVP